VQAINALRIGRPGTNLALPRDPSEPSDPLGENMALAQRAQDRAHEYYDPLVQQLGVAGAEAARQAYYAEQQDPQGFNALNQALYEKGARVTSAPGLSSSPMGQPSTLFAPGQTSAVPTPPSISALRTRRGYPVGVSQPTQEMRGSA